MKRQSTELLKGTLDLLVLKTLDLEPRHGVAIADRIAQVTGGTFVVKPGSLFPALHRLEAEGFIEGAWELTADGRRVKLYRLTGSGRKHLQTGRRQWSRIALAMNQVLEAE
jgi:transcriptional regulator